VQAVTRQCCASLAGWIERRAFEHEPSTITHAPRTSVDSRR
jgi:hypothetical protein